MDSDGEDRPVEIKDLIKTIKENPNISVVAKRPVTTISPVWL